MNMDAIAGTRRPCFIEEDDGLASLAEVEAGFSGSHHHHHHNNYAFYSRPLYYSRRSSFRSLPTSSSSFSASSSSASSSSSFSPRSGGGRFYDARFEEPQPHFLEACFLCKKPLADNKDIFMYRGDTPFCSEACRAEQIEMDEAKEKNMSLSSMKALRNNNKDQRNSASPTKNQNYPCCAGTVAAA